jgi:hypothetical protein
MIEIEWFFSVKGFRPTLCAWKKMIGPPNPSNHPPVKRRPYSRSVKGRILLYEDSPGLFTPVLNKDTGLARQAWITSVDRS